MSRLDQGKVRIILSGLFFLTLFLEIILGASQALAQNSQSAKLFFSSSSKEVKEGEKIIIDVKLTTSLGQSINAIYGVVSYPSNLVRVTSLVKEKSIVNLWTQEPKLRLNNILFEGIILNPGFQGSNGLIFRIIFEARKSGRVSLNFNEGSVLANDGMGTNVLTSLGSINFKIFPRYPDPEPIVKIEEPLPPIKPLLLPTITKFSSNIGPEDMVQIEGKGEPNALTKIVFEDLSFKSLGEKFIALLQTQKKKLNEILVKNDIFGNFEYLSAKNLVAGVYNATPFLVDTNTNTEKPGFGVQFLVNDSQIVKTLVVVINILALLIPIVGLMVIIYFIPWYSWKRMRVLKKKLGLEEEKIEIFGHQLERQDRMLDQNIDKTSEKEQPNNL